MVAQERLSADCDQQLFGRVHPLTCDSIEPTDDILRNGLFLLGTHCEDRGIQTRSYEQALKFETNLGPRQRKSIRLMVSTSKTGLLAG